jgi:hypothetical protein
MTSLSRCLPIALALALVTVAHSDLAAAGDREISVQLPVAPVSSQPEGQSYGRWAAEWWQWALGVPAATNPLLDTTGEQCGQRQLDRVWFLAGSLSSDPVVRSCEVPAGTSLFFPLINNFYGAFLSDPPETRTEEFVRETAACTEDAEIAVRINGIPIPNPQAFFTGRSVTAPSLFNIQLPPGNLLGADETIVPELALSPSAEQGYYLFVNPLPVGNHRIRWTASGCTTGNVQDITYDLTIVANGNGSR